MDPVNFFTEMRRRNVFRVAGTYFVGAWFLVQTAFTLESVMNLPDWFDALFMSLMILGAPVVVVLAWAFELTPDGFKRTENISKEDSIAAQTGRRLEVVIILGLAVIGGLLIADRVMPNESVKTASFANNNSVAVLPFSNRSAEETDSYFADGIHDDLLTQLSKMSGLEVISRTSVMGYKDTQKRIPEIAEELKVAVVLEGAVQRAGDRVRITVQLIDGKDDKHLWAENYDRALTTENIFDIQAEITKVIATALETVISGKDKEVLDETPTENLAAYESYIQGKLVTPDGSPNIAPLKEAISSFDRAIDLDPNFGLAYAKKAYAQIAIYWFGGRDTSYRDAALETLKRAKGLSTHLSEAFYYYWGFRDFHKADEIFDHALKVAPNNVQALAGKAFIARRLGRFEEASNDLAKAHRLDPLSFYLIPELGLTYALIGDFETANNMIALGKTREPDSLQGAAFEAAILQFQGDAIGAFNALESTGTILQEQKMSYAIATRNPLKIAATLESWPEDTRAPLQSPEAYNIARIKGLLATGQAVEEELSALKARIAKVPPSVDWSGASRYSPVIIPGLLGDLEMVNKLAADYELNAPDDSMTALTHLGDLVEAYARAGDADKAMNYADKMRALTGPHIYLVLRIEPGLDNIRDHPRYQKYKADYETWAVKETG